MRIVAISDTHGAHDQLQGLYALPQGDVLVHAGDFTNGGSLEEVAAFGVWLAKQPFKHKIVVAGNHDGCFASEPGEARKLLGDCLYLQDSSCTLEGLLFWGSPWCPNDRIDSHSFSQPANPVPPLPPDKIDVLVTHGGVASCLSFDTLNGDVHRSRTIRLHIYGHNANQQSTAGAEEACFAGVLESQLFDLVSVGRCATVIDIGVERVESVTLPIERRYADYCQRFVHAALQEVFHLGRRRVPSSPPPPRVDEEDWLDGLVLECTRAWVQCDLVSFRHPKWPEYTEAIGRDLFPRDVQVGDRFSLQLGVLPDKSWQITVWLARRPKRPKITLRPPGDQVT